MEVAWRTGFVRSGPLLLEYKIRPSAQKPWLLFLHGFGQDYASFFPFAERKVDRYAMLVLHLPFHGESQLEAEVLLPDDWCIAFQAILLKEKISSVYGIGFSMGARFLMTAAIRLPEVFRGIALLAPDGLQMNFWYSLATGSAAGRQVFRILITCFPVLRGFIRLLNLLKIIRPGYARFALSELREPVGRARLLASWSGFRRIWPDFIEFQNAAEKIPVCIVLGKYDGIIPALKFKKLRQTHPFWNWTILDTGHAGLIAAFARKELPDESA